MINTSEVIIKYLPGKTKKHPKSSAMMFFGYSEASMLKIYSKTGIGGGFYGYINNQS